MYHSENRLSPSCSKKVSEVTQRQLCFAQLAEQTATSRRQFSHCSSRRESRKSKIRRWSVYNSLLSKCRHWSLNWNRKFTFFGKSWSSQMDHLLIRACHQQTLKLSRIMRKVTKLLKPFLRKNLRKEQKRLSVLQKPELQQSPQLLRKKTQKIQLLPRIRRKRHLPLQLVLHNRASQSHPSFPLIQRGSRLRPCLLRLRLRSLHTANSR